MSLNFFYESDKQPRLYRFYSSLNKFEDFRLTKSDILSKFILYRDLGRSCVCYVFNTRYKTWSYCFGLDNGVYKHIHNCHSIFSEEV